MRVPPRENKLNMTENRGALARGDDIDARAFDHDPWIPLIWQANPTGGLTRADARWLAYTGIREDLALGRGWRRCVHPDDLSETLERWRAASLRGRRFESCHRLQAEDGSYRWFLERATPIWTDGVLIGWRVVCTDVHETREELARQSELLVDATAQVRTRQLLSEAGVGVLEFDPTGRLSFATREAQTALSASSEVLCGKTVQELLPRLLEPGALARIARGLPRTKSSFTERELGVVKSWVKFCRDADEPSVTLYFRSFNLESPRPLVGENVKTRAAKH
jgi:PAS domain S-box-containing protein